MHISLQGCLTAIAWNGCPDAQEPRCTEHQILPQNEVDSDW